MKPTEKTKKNSSKVSSRLSLGERVPKLRFPGFEGEWESKKFGSLICETNNRTTKENEDILLSAAIEGMFLNSELFDHQRGISNKGYKKISRNTLILSTQNLHLGNANVNLRFEHGIVSPAYKTYDIIGCNHYLLSHWIKSEKAKKFFYDATTVGASLCRRNVEWETLYEQTLVLPSLDEQNHLANFLNLLIARVAAQRKLVELLKKHKRGLSSALFSGKVRIATNAKWRTYRLGDIVRRVTRKNGKATDIPLTISAQHGLIDQREFFSKAVASADMSGYYLLKQGEFAYNRSSSGEYPFGSIKKLERYHQGAVSTLYICFETLGDKDDAEFLKWYFDSFAWHREIGMICAEGARNHGLLNVPTDGFFDTKHILPSDKDERKKIASLMALADARCECAETELARLMAMKSGLLQQMFV